jgi:dihydrolipoamide dehydrogenase
VFTDPEIAWVGLTEKEAAERGIAHKVVRFPWAASGRAATLDRDDGLTKLIIDPQSERVIGMGIAGPGAGEMIAEGALAIEMGANVTDVGLTIHPHPTLTETIMEAADLFHGTATHFYQPKRKSG